MRLAAFVLAFLLPLVSNATHHLWRMSEIYSNADGSVQYLMFVVEANNEHLMTGHGIFSTHGGEQRAFIFPNNLPSPGTAFTSFLVGTEGFAALNLVTPDYVVPNGFFSPAGGLVDFASLDYWQYPALPTTGGRALQRAGIVADGYPTNFAGRVARMVDTPAAAPGLNFQGLWYRAPAESEAGWGVNVTHQGDILFATWFTYDTDGSDMWLVASDLRKSGPNAYSGTLYRTTGPSFDAAPFDPSRVTVSAVGTASLTFANEGSGTFSYTVGGVTQSKPITRQVFSSPVPRCAASTGALPSAGAAPNYQDLWWRASESGWGMNVAHQGEILFVTWFTYGADGRARWLVMSDARRTAPGTYSGTIYRTRGPAYDSAQWNVASVTLAAVGTGTLTFADAGNGTFAYTLDGVSQSKGITRQSFATPATVCN